MNNLSLFFKCNQLYVNCIIKNQSIDFKYQQASTSLNFSPNTFKYLCTLENKSNSNLQLFNQSKDKCFSFFTLNKNDKTKSSKTKVFKTEIFDYLFTNSNKLVDSVLLIGSSDGYLYWYPLDSLGHEVPSSLNNFILFNTNSPIVLIETFKINDEKNPFDTLIKSNTEKTNKYEDNCLFSVTKSGKVYMYFYQSEISYKISVLPHNVELCVKKNHLKQDYLIYTTLSNEVYAVKLEEIIKNTNLKTYFLIKVNSRINMIRTDDSENVTLIQTNGKNIEIDLKKHIQGNGSKTRDNESADVSTIKTYLSKLSTKSNEIVNYQIKMDLINSALKQLNILQNIRFNSKDYFELEKKILDKRLEVKMKNKNAHLEDNQTYYLLTCIRFEKFNSDLSKSFSWKSSLQCLKTCKVNMEQRLSFDFELKLFPSKIKMFLVFDVEKFLKQKESLELDFEQTIGEFVVNIYESDLNLFDFFSLTPSPKESSCNFRPSVFFNLLTNKQDIFENRTKLEKIWNTINIDGPLVNKNYFKDQCKTVRNLVFSNISLNYDLKMANEDEQTFNLKFEILDEPNDFWMYFVQNLENFVFVKNNFILKDLMLERNSGCNQISFGSNQTKILESISIKLEEIDAQKSTYLVVENNSENRIDIDDDHYDHQINNKNQFYSIHTILNLIDIYLNLRNYSYSNLKLNGS